MEEEVVLVGVCLVTVFCQCSCPQTARAYRPYDDARAKEHPACRGAERTAVLAHNPQTLEAAPESKAARSRARRASIKDTEAALAEMFARGAKGTKDGPGRCTSRSRTPPAHSRAPRQGSPDNIWAPVRARRAAIQAADALREPDLPGRHARTREMHIERERQLSKERSQRLLRSHRMRKGLSSQEEPIVRV